MAETGLNFISFGAQSANREVLRNIYRKPEELDALRENLAWCRKLGIGTSLAYIFGMPGDTPDTAREAVRFALEAKPLLADFHPLWYIEGSELSDRFPACDGNPYSYQEHKKWSTAARRRFYFSPGVVFRFFLYIGKHNPRYFLKLLSILIEGIPRFLFERGKVMPEESGDKRTYPDRPDD